MNFSFTQRKVFKISFLVKFVITFFSLECVEVMHDTIVAPVEGESSQAARGALPLSGPADGAVALA